MVAVVGFSQTEGRQVNCTRRSTVGCPCRLWCSSRSDALHAVASAALVLETAIYFGAVGTAREPEARAEWERQERQAVRDLRAAARALEAFYGPEEDENV